MDVSRVRHHVGFTDATATATPPGGPLTVPNDAAGALQLAHAIQAHALTHGCDAVRMGCEATGVYAWHLALWLSQPTDPPRPLPVTERPLACKVSTYLTGESLVCLTIPDGA